MLKEVSVFFLLLVSLSACGRHMASNIYNSNAPVGKAIEGVVISSKAITIKDNEKVSGNSLGGVAGAGIGAALGSGIGSRNGNTAATVGGTIIGNIVGSFIGDALSTQEGFEYIVKVKTSLKAKNYKKKNDISVGNSIDNDIKGSIELDSIHTNLISVIQGKDVVFQPGQKVLVVYHDDRPRLVAAN